MGDLGKSDLPTESPALLRARFHTNRYLHGFICRPDAASDLLRRLSDAVEACKGLSLK